MKMKMMINERLAEAMDATDSNIQTLAWKAKVHPATLSRILHGSVKPRLMTGWRIAKALNTTAETLGLTDGTRNATKTEVIES